MSSTRRSSSTSSSRRKPRLLEDTVWYLEDARELVKSEVAYPRPKRHGETVRTSSFRPTAATVDTCKRSLAPYVPAGQTLRPPRSGRGHPVLVPRPQALRHRRAGPQRATMPGYQINADALRWLAGDGEMRPIDRTRLLEAGEIPPEVNRYFVECYRRFVDLKCVLEAREHTAQVTSEDREEREERFRTGDLPLLFCSPTMELGVDIAQLNLVNLRNVPPTPANYAQRSGRAGRGGQPALVFTYCAGRSPHDQYFFREPEQDGRGLGRAAPHRPPQPRPGSRRTFMRSGWRSPSRTSGKTLTTVVDLTPADGKTAAARQGCADPRELRNPAHRAAALAKANAAGREHPGASCPTRGVVSRRTGPGRFSTRSSAASMPRASVGAACIARPSASASCITRSSATTARPDAERNHSRRLRAQAESQIRLLTEAEGIYEGDFYSYRYFAAEGFLPGYNFPRLPLSAYVPGRRQRKGRDEFVSRPRFLAISEFGPRALIYHEGARYRVYKVNLDFGSDDIEATHELVTATMKRCPKCGYAHLEQGNNLAEVCDRCGAALEGPARDRESRPAAEREPQARPAHHLRRGGAPALRLQARHVLPLPGDRRASSTARTRRSSSTARSRCG